MDEEYPIPHMETIFHNLHGASYFGNIDLSGAYYQIEIDEEAKDIHYQHISGLFKMCRLPQGLKNSSSIFQNCMESTLKGIKSVVIFQDDVLVYGIMEPPRSRLTGECLLSRVDYVKFFLLLMRKSLIQNKLIALVSWNTPFQRSE